MSLRYAPGTFPYIIQTDDTLWNLAERYDIDVEAIFAVNPGIEADNLLIGQVIAMPGDPPSSRGPEFEDRSRSELERRRRAELERRRREESARKRREEERRRREGRRH